MARIVINTSKPNVKKDPKSVLCSVSFLMSKFT